MNWKRYLDNYLKPGVVIVAILALLFLILRFLGIEIYET